MAGTYSFERERLCSSRSCTLPTEPFARYPLLRGWLLAECDGFTLLGVDMGVRMRKGETTDLHMFRPSNLIYVLWLRSQYELSRLVRVCQSVGTLACLRERVLDRLFKRG